MDMVRCLEFETERMPEKPSVTVHGLCSLSCTNVDQAPLVLMLGSPR